MIVKKIPILRGFPALETVKYLSNTKNELSEYNPIFYDIETTGLSRYTAFVYLIGAVRFEENQWMLYQWMGEDENEEALVLQEFASFLTNADCTIQYNGNRFDQPFLEERYRKHKMDTPFKEILSLDLYQLLKPCQSLFKLSKMKQPDLENFVGIHNRKYCDGGQCIRLYRTFMKKKDPEAANIVMGHNEEDLLGLGTIFSLLAYKKLYDGEYHPKQCVILEQELKIVIELSAAAPVNVSCGNSDFYLSVMDTKQECWYTLKKVNSVNITEIIKIMSLFREKILQCQSPLPDIWIKALKSRQLLKLAIPGLIAMRIF